MKCLSVALTQKKTLLIGAGKVAAQKAKVLSSVGFEFTVLAEEILDDYFNDKTITIGSFSEEIALPYEMIIDATGNDAVTQVLLEIKKKRSLFLNVVDRPEFCDFYFSALTQRGDIQVAVSSAGSSPTLAQVIRDKIEKILPKNLDTLIERLKNERKKENRDLESLKSIAKSGVGKVFLVGCGTGSVGNLTLRALESFELFDVALVDALVSQEIRALIPLTCKVLDVSKKKGFHSKNQDEINALLVQYAKEGLVVGRLKGGDPSLFGRLGEEKAILAKNGIDCVVINGITSALRACSVAGIVPTIRDVSKGVTIVSAHLKETLFNDDWVVFLKQPRHTVIVLMAHSFAGKIQDAIAKAGIDASLPAAFVSKIDMEDQSVVLGNVGKLDKMAQLCQTPAVLIIGECAAHENVLPCERGKLINLQGIEDGIYN
ncbi:MAG: uroporphyrinogen-III C-methyltransferase [Sulfurospirillaceae bacterium]|nr:uroporphyrinogen-III C-methyltransferase [Sulfurospirillaceae bacterium]